MLLKEQKENLSSENNKTVSLAQIRKRDGRLVDFDSSKIVKAILKAGKTTGEFTEEIAKQLMVRVVNLAQTVFANQIPTVEGLQDLVEDVLLTSPFKKVAKAYILYRDQHARIREMSCQMDVKLIDSYLKRLDWRVNENSNMSFSLQGLNNYLSNEVSKTYWLNKIYTPEIREAHLSGALHIHDLGLLSTYCVGWDLHDLLVSGFCGVEGKTESKPPKHFRSALGQVVNFFYTLQGEAAGAQAFSSFDTLLAPFIRYDELSYREVKQAMQECIFNLNVPTRVGFQTPFTNVTLDLQPPSTLANQPVIIGGKPQKETYSAFQKEMDWFNRAFLEVMSEGDAKGRVFTFPIPTYNITADFNWDNENLDLLWKVTGKYGIPYFANFVNSDMSPDDARSMCCRLRLDLRSLRKRGGGLFGSNPLTGSAGVVTINMARIGYLATNRLDFFARLDQLMEIARSSLETKRKVLERFTKNGLYPYTQFYLRDVYNKSGQYWCNHFSTIGVIGLNEACLNFLGCGIGEKEGQDFAVEVLEHMREKLQRFQEETGCLYNLEATPAEGTTYRLAKIDQKKYPKLLCANHEDVKARNAAPFYTNSSHLPVNYTEDVFHLLDMQDKLQTCYTGGTVLHIFLGEAVADFKAVKQCVKKICSDYHLPYFTLTPTFSVCSSHGYLEGEHKSCSHCNQATEVYSRVVGYYRPTKQWNLGKQEEYGLRSCYSVHSSE